MEYLWALFIVYLFLLIIALFFSKGMLTSPSVIMLISFCIMFGLAIACYDYFLFEIKRRTFWVMSVSAFIFVISEQVVSAGFKWKRIHKESVKPIPIIIDSSWRKLIFFISVFTLIFSIYVIMHTGNGSWTSRMHTYRTYMMQKPDLIPYRFLLAQLYKVDLACSHILGYALMYNLTMCKARIKDNIFDIFSVVLFVIVAFISQGARQPVLEYIVYIGLIYVLLKEQEKQNKDIAKFVLRSIPLIFFLAYLFYYTMVLAGRTFHAGKSVLHYVAEYFCGGLYAFNHHIDSPAISSYFGRQSFKELYSFFAKLHIMDSSVVNFQPAFDKYGNTATLYGRWYEDFGTLGVFIMVILVSTAFAYGYNKLKRTHRTSNKYHIRIILYSYLVIALVWAGYDDRIKAIISMTMVFKVLLIYFFYLVLIRKKIRLNKRNTNAVSYM